MNTNRMKFEWGILLVAVGVHGATVRETEIYEEARLAVRVAAGSIDLPRPGTWTLIAAEPAGTCARDLFLEPTAAVQRVTPDLGTSVGDGGDVAPPGSAPQPPPDETRQPTGVRHRVFARVAGTGSAAVTLRLRHDVTGETVDVGWDLSAGKPGPATLLAAWARLRAVPWGLMQTSQPTTVLSLWLGQVSTLYGMEEPRDPSGGPRRGGIGNEETILGVVGGRAAIRETLQLQDLAPGDPGADEVADIPIESVPGVAVKAHPYEEMLAGAGGGRLGLAEVVPPDRFFAFFPQPAALAGLLDAGGVAAPYLGQVFGSESIRYDVLDRYVARLGMTRDGMRSLLQSGAVTELAIFLPDLFLIDGTDITVVARLGQMGWIGSVLKLAGLGDLESLCRRELPGGDVVVWCRRGDLLFISSSEGELRQCLGLHEKRGEGSLGQSAEFRYMLTELAPRATTQAYLYFSDPFLRRLTGPVTKIAQYRRVLTRAQLEATTAAAMLYALDHDGESASVSRLFELGYARQIPGVALTDITLGEGWLARSARYGTAARLRTLLEVPVGGVTRREQAAYASYRDNYQRFWRQFFDPIALRLDRVASNRIELATFILPLIDSSLYTGLRGVLATAEDRVPLTVPVIEPEPVATLSANVTRTVWPEWLRGPDEFLKATWGGSSWWLDQLGPSIHFVLADGDPIIATGSGDLLGSLGGGRGRVGNDMFMIPLTLSMLTRPSSLLLEVRDPAVVRRELNRAATGTWPGSPGFLGFTTSFYRVADREEWVLGISAEQWFTIRFGIRLQGRYLVISNLPLTHRPRVIEAQNAVHQGLNLRLSPRAASLLLPSLFESAMNGERRAALRGAGMLYPLTAVGMRGIEDAIQAHLRLFGYAPRHPDGGSYVLDGTAISSTRFGAPGVERQPAFTPGFRDFGILRGVSEVEVSMQFEKDGLRALAAWSLDP